MANPVEDILEVHGVPDLEVRTVLVHAVLAQEVLDHHVSVLIPEEGLHEAQVLVAPVPTDRVLFARLRNAVGLYLYLVRDRDQCRRLGPVLILKRWCHQVRGHHQLVLDHGHLLLRRVRVLLHQHRNLLQGITRNINLSRRRKLRHAVKKNIAPGYRKIHVFQILFH